MTLKVKCSNQSITKKCGTKCAKMWQTCQKRDPYGSRTKKPKCNLKIAKPCGKGCIQKNLVCNRRSTKRATAR